MFETKWHGQNTDANDTVGRGNNMLKRHDLVGLEFGRSSNHFSKLFSFWNGGVGILIFKNWVFISGNQNLHESTDWRLKFFLSRNCFGFVLIIGNFKVRSHATYSILTFDIKIWNWLQLQVCENLCFITKKTVSKSCYYEFMY